VLAVVGAIAGTGIGWWLCGLRKAAENNKAADQAQLVLDRLKMLATNMAANVDEHTSRVQEINTDLQAQSAEGGDECVVSSITKIIEANTQMQSKLQEAESRLEEQAVEIETQFTAARTDQLTCVANRRAFDDTLAECYKQWTKKNVPFSTLLIDVDFFKKFNDTYGHLAGDEVLVGVAAALSKSMRDKDIVARYGGEEFAVIFPQTKLEDAMPAAERARKAIEESVFPFEGENLKVTVSVGLAQVRGTDTAEMTVKNADAGLYVSKEAGRNCSHYHDGEKFVPLTPRVKETASATTDNAASATTDTSKSFNDELKRRVAECQRFDVPLSIMRIEVDNFATLKQELGESGDRAVMDTVNEILTTTLREMDLAAETHVGQLSAMLPGSEVHDAAGVAERIREKIAACSIPGADNASVTVSLGLTHVVPCDDIASLLGRADDALDASHKAAGNCGHQHDGKQILSIGSSVASE
jgi:diguanylate cyclase